MTTPGHLHRAISFLEGAVEYLPAPHRARLLGHGMGVASHVLFHRPLDHELVVAGALHPLGQPPVDDSLIETMGTYFGPTILTLVEACSDGAPDLMGPHPVMAAAGPWRHRKEIVLQRCHTTDDRTLLLIGCDALHTLQSLLTGDVLGDASVPPRVLEAMITWFYPRLTQVMTLRRCPVAKALVSVTRDVYLEFGKNHS